MERANWEALQQGDIIRHGTSGQTYVVLMGKVPGSSQPVIVARTVAAYNQYEWDLVGVVHYPQPRGTHTDGT